MIAVYRYRRIVQAKLYIDRHFAEPIQAGNIAAEASFSTFHFTRLFRLAYGKTPHQYLTAVRLGKARELLKSAMPVGEVCGEVGFESITSFAGLFKRAFGMTPSAFQQQHRARQQELLRRPLKYIPGCFASHQGWQKKSNFEEA